MMVLEPTDWIFELVVISHPRPGAPMDLFWLPRNIVMCDGWR